MKNRRELLKAIPFLAVAPLVRFSDSKTKNKLFIYDAYAPKSDSHVTVTIEYRCADCGTLVSVETPVRLLAKYGTDEDIRCDRCETEQQIFIQKARKSVNEGYAHVTEIHPYDTLELVSSADPGEILRVNGEFIGFRGKLYRQTLSVSPTTDPDKYWDAKRKILNES